MTEYYEKNDLDINKVGIQGEIYDKYKIECLLKYQIWYFANYFTYGIRIFFLSSILLKFKIRRFQTVHESKYMEAKIRDKTIKYHIYVNGPFLLIIAWGNIIFWTDNNENCPLMSTGYKDVL